MTRFQNIVTTLWFAIDLWRNRAFFLKLAQAERNRAAVVSEISHLSQLADRPLPQFVDNGRDLFAR